MFYVETKHKILLKIDGTKIDGPWSNLDEKPTKMPYHLQIIKLWSWQREILARARYNKNSRKIVCVYCPKGASGKTTVMMYAKNRRIIKQTIVVTGDA